MSSFLKNHNPAIEARRCRGAVDRYRDRPKRHGGDHTKSEANHPGQRKTAQQLSPELLCHLRQFRNGDTKSGRDPMDRVPGRICLAALDHGQHVQRDPCFGRKRFQAIPLFVAQLADRLSQGDVGKSGLLAPFQSRLGILVSLRLQT